MSYWKNSDNPYHTDEHYVKHENEFIAQALLHVKKVFPAEICKGMLDIGCGNPERTRTLQGKAGYWPDTTFGDKYPSDPDVYEMDILDLAKGEFDVILCCRTLCNVPQEYRALALSNLYRALTPRGYLILIDGFSRERRNINDARFEAEFSQLPHAPSESQTIDDCDRKLLEGGLFKPQICDNIAADYIIHTRVCQKDLIPFGEKRARAVPYYTEDARHLFGYYQGIVATKVPHERNTPTG
jgi:SAM-dependent methyltransferase